MMNLELVTLSGVKISEDVYEIRIPTVDGPISVFPGHEPLVTLADNGVLEVRRKKSDPDSAMDVFATYGGIVEIAPKSVRILVDEADTADEIMEEEAKKAYETAEQLRANAHDQVELEKAKAELDRHAVRLKVAGLRRHRRP